MIPSVTVGNKSSFVVVTLRTHKIVGEMGEEARDRGGMRAFSTLSGLSMRLFHYLISGPSLELTAYLSPFFEASKCFICMSPCT